MSGKFGLISKYRPGCAFLHSYFDNTAGMIWKKEIYMQKTARRLRKFTDKQKLFMMCIAFVGPIRIRTREDRIALAKAFECSERTIVRVISGLKKCSHIDLNYFNEYFLLNPELTILGELRSSPIKSGPIGSTPQMNRGRQPDNCPADFGEKPDKFLPRCLTCPIDEACFRVTEEDHVKLPGQAKRLSQGIWDSLA